MCQFSTAEIRQAFTISDAEKIIKIYKCFNEKAQNHQILIQAESDLTKRFLIEKSWGLFWIPFLQKRAWKLPINDTNYTFYDFFIEQLKLVSNNIEASDFKMELPIFYYFHFELLMGLSTNNRRVVSSIEKQFKKRLLNESPLINLKWKGLDWQLDMIQNTWVNFFQICKKGLQFKKINDFSDESVYYFFRNDLKFKVKDDGKRKDTNYLDLEVLLNKGGVNYEKQYEDRMLIDQYMRDLRTMSEKCFFVFFLRFFWGFTWKEIEPLFNKKFDTNIKWQAIQIMWSRCRAKFLKKLKP